MYCIIAVSAAGPRFFLSCEGTKDLTLPNKFTDVPENITTKGAYPAYDNTKKNSIGSIYIFFSIEAVL